MVTNPVDSSSARSDRHCPHCSGGRVHRWGKPSGSQRYRCQDCGRTFNALTGTNIAGLRHPERWVDYRAAMVEKLSIRRAAERCGIDPTTAQRWRHRLADPPQEPSSAPSDGAPVAAPRRTPQIDSRDSVDFVDWVHAMVARDGGTSMRAHLDGMFGLGRTAAGSSRDRLGKTPADRIARRPR